MTRTASVEHGEAPDNVVLIKKEQDQAVRSQAGISLPTNSIYRGTGDPNVESRYSKH
ncbi:MAG: hypothetical protein HKN76_08135 [Saprospiraceae bacterium]|nr:hypothetical protein [Saprospiraceae bacterium]